MPSALLNSLESLKIMTGCEAGFFSGPETCQPLSQPVLRIPVKIFNVKWENDKNKIEITLLPIDIN